MSMRNSPRVLSFRRGRWLGLALILVATHAVAEPIAHEGQGHVERAGPVLPGPSPIAVLESALTPPLREAEDLLDLEACVRIAVDENPVLRAAEEGVKAAAESIGVASAPYYPSVGLNAGYRRFDSHLFFPSEFSLQRSTLGATDDWSAALTVGYTLYDHGQRAAERDAARARRAASDRDVASVRQDVVFAVHEAYYGVLASRASYSAAETRLARANDHLDVAVARHESGAAPLADVLRARVDVAEAELGRVRAQGSLRVSSGRLKTAMGLPVTMPIHVAETRERMWLPDEEDPAAAIQRALRQRPEVHAARQRIEAARSQTRAIRGEFGPRVRAEGSIGLRDSAFLPEDQNWAVGVFFQIPLFSGFAEEHRRARAEADVRTLEQDTNALANRISLEVWTAESELDEAHEAVARSQILQDEAAETLEFVRARYEAGAATIVDLLDAESALAQADASRVTARFEERIARSRLPRARGDL